jgi:decaprenylphospho-beta-D-ribofuranose 2-oxidase
MTAISYTDRVLTGWGRTAPSRSIVGEPQDPAPLQELVASRPARGLLGRGAGRSYGDAALNTAGYVISPISPPRLELDEAAATLHASAGATFTEILAAAVPHGLLPPVLPGTSQLTIGGAVAADVHGKNHRHDGSIAAWIDEIELLDGSGTVRRLTPGRDRDAFLATTGGMGLTGIILAVTLRLLRIRSAVLEVSSRRLDDLDGLLTALDSSDSRYSVAWIDTTAAGRSLGRGIVDTGDHLPGPDPLREPDGLSYRPPRARRAPALPLCPVRPWSARGFNSLFFHRAPSEHRGLADVPAFFHRLDAVAGWNRTIGPRGLIQYQFAVPDGGEKLIARALETVQRRACAPFLGTLKRFGPASGGLLSFPLAGWSLAIDMPAGRPGLAPALAELDHEVADAGGRVYLAKDARLGPASFEAMYGPPGTWRAVRAELDPHGVFQSDLGRRLGLCGN